MIDPTAQLPVTRQAKLLALEESIVWFGAPEIVNTDQGSQFTSLEFVGTLQDNRIAITRPPETRRDFT